MPLQDPRLLLRPLGLAIVLALVFVASCSRDLGIDDIDFACEDDTDCSEGYHCVEAEGEDYRVCAEDSDEPEPDPDCDCDPGDDEYYTCDDGECVYESCDDDTANCDGTTQCDTAIDTVDHCGGCDLACEFDTDSPNATATCDDGTCLTECDEDWHNADGEFDTGCECSLSTDPADAPKCPGVAIYVDADGGDDANDGYDPDNPSQTLSGAITRARQDWDEEEDEVFILMLAEGTYVSEQTIDIPLNIVGGLNPDDDWQRTDDDDRSTIEHGDTDDDGIKTTLVIDREGDFSREDVVLANLEIEPPDTPNTENGDDWNEHDASIASLRVQNVHEATTYVRDSIIEGGTAGEGLAGEEISNTDLDDGQAGEPGIPHDTGAGFQEIIAGGDGGDSACDGHGGSGGDARTCNYDDPLEGDPGTDVGPAEGGTAGDIGDKNSACGEGEQAITADDAGHGGIGDSGEPGVGGQFDTELEEDVLVGNLTSQGLWTTIIGGDGEAGEHGAGGGGGGGGSSQDTHSGGSGGGGGGGGCGGPAGTAGMPGGASFGAIVIAADLHFEEDTTIFVGDGGDGGEGGDGSCGSSGGLGGAGGDAQGTSSGVSSGGCGGMGGHGGIGGGGAGGIGGPAIGIATVDDATVDGDYAVNDVDAFGGVGGAGGQAPDGDECYDDFSDASNNEDDGDVINCPEDIFVDPTDILSGDSGESGPDGAVIDEEHFTTSDD